MHRAHVLLLTFVFAFPVHSPYVPPSDVETAELLTADEALRVDAGLYAEEFGVTDEEGYRRLSLQDDARALTARAEAALPSRFAGAWLEHVPDFKLIIAFVGPSDSLAPVRALIHDSPLQVELRPDRSHSLAQMREALAQAEVVLERQGQPFAFGLDIQTGTLEVFGPEEPTTTSLATAEERTGLPVRFETSPLATNQHTYAGARARQPDGRDCTTGFTARHDPTGNTGVLTAAHCANSLTYFDPVNGGSHELTAQGGKYDSNQDFQWMTASAHADYPYIWDGQFLRTVLAEVQRAQMEGDWVCHRGEETQVSCGTVSDAFYDPGSICGPGGADDCSASWVRVGSDSLRCAGGDSGGPWYIGNTAYGIHKAGINPTGGLTAEDCFGAVFMAIGYIWYDGDWSLLKG